MGSVFRPFEVAQHRESIKPSDMLAKLKRHLPYGADCNNDMFLAMFLLRLPPSIREAVGSADHTTIAAMVRHADRVWDFRGDPDPVVAAAAEQRSRSPASSPGRRGEKKEKTPLKKSHRQPSQFSKLQKPEQRFVQVSQLLWCKGKQVRSPCNQSEN